MTLEFTSATPARLGQAEDHTDDGVPRDGHDRYAICDEHGNAPAQYKNGNAIGRTRASTNAKVVGDKSGVQKWRDEMLMRGVAKDPALFASVLKAVNQDDKMAIRALAGRAFETGGGKVAASRGTAFHDVTERIKKGEQVSPDSIPAENRRDVDSYLQALAEHQIFPVAGAQELVLILPHGAAGKADDVFRWLNPFTEEWELIVGDTKTGQRIWEFGDYEMAAQLWQYANHLAVWNPPADGDPAHGTAGPRIDVRRDRALILNTPLNGTTQVTLLDLNGMERDMEAVQTIRRGRAEAKLRVHHLGMVDLREAVHTGTEAPPVVTVGGSLALQPGFQSTPTAPTPDAAANEQAAKARLAKLDEMARADGRNDGDDDEHPEETKLIEANPGLSYEAAHALVNGRQDDAPDTPTHDPVTGRKKRACGHCRKPGHTAKNCPEDPASPKYVPPLAAAAVAEAETKPTIEQKVETMEALTTAHPVPAVGPRVEPAWMPTPEELAAAGVQPGQTFSVAPPASLELHEPPNGAGPFCPGSHDGRTVTGWANGTGAFTGMSVDAHCGLPTQLHYDAMMKTRAERAAHREQPAEARAAGLYQPPAVDQQRASALAAVPFPALIPEDQIKQWLADAPTQLAVLKIRQDGISSGVWSEELDDLARRTHEALNVPPAWPAT